MTTQTTARDLRPLVPVLTDQELADIRLYYRAFEKYADEISALALEDLKTHPVFGELVRSSTTEAAEAQNRHSRALQRQAILDENWIPYLEYQIQQGNVYAKMGFDFKSWYEIVVLAKKYLVPYLIKEYGKGDEFLAALSGMNRFVDIGMAIIGEAYLDEKQQTILKEREELQRILQEVADYKYALDESAIVAVTDQKGIITHVNDNFCNISKYSREELIGKDHRIINSGYHSKTFIQDIWVTIANGKVWKGELRNKAKDGSIYWVDTTIVPFLNEKKKPYRYLAIRSDITERKRNEEELTVILKEVSDYKYALDESAIIAVTDQKGIITHVNDNFCKISKYNREELLGKDHRIINSAYHPKEFIRDIWVTIANGKVWKGELRNKAKDGSIYWVDTTIVPFLNEQKKPYQYLAIRSDITERKKAEEEITRLNEDLEEKVTLRTAELQQSLDTLSKFKKLFENIPGMYMVLTPDFVISTVSNEYAESTLLTPETMIGRHLFEVFPDNPDDPTADGVANLRTSLETVLRTKKAHEMALQKYDVRRPDGTFEERYWLPLNKPVFNEKGEVIYIIHRAEDVTQRLYNERELLRISDENRDLYDNAPCGYIGVDSSLYIVNINKTLLTWLGYTEDEVLNKMKFEDLLSPESREIQRRNLKANFDEFVSKGSVTGREYEFQRKNGTVFPTIMNAMAIFNEDGSFQKSRTVVFDNTFRKESEQRLREINIELEAQTQKLQASEEELKAQQEELMQANIELEEKSLLLEEKNQVVNEKNEELILASHELHQKAEELSQSNRYKSEFLANMSHELRTPLNSILLLSKLLADNNDKNLTTEQAEFAGIIHHSGSGLLELINEILDLSKIESGNMTLDIEEVPLENLCKNTQSMFTPLAREKGIQFSIENTLTSPQFIKTDRVRLEQVLKNFLSNAVKFTEKGSVSMVVREPDAAEQKVLADGYHHALVFEVSDTGIGIPPEKQSLVFEAFKQADGSTRRKYGGTGLGLSISRKIAMMLGGNVVLRSEVGKGSSFSLVIPVDISVPVNADPDILSRIKKMAAGEGVPETDPEDGTVDVKRMAEISDDQQNLQDGDKIILLVERDATVAQSLVKLIQKKGYKVVFAYTTTMAIDLAAKHKPLGVLLDLKLNTKSGWSVLKELKKNQATRHIPIHLMSADELNGHEFAELGAIDIAKKPVVQKALTQILERIEEVSSHFPKTVLLVDDNEVHTNAVKDFMAASSLRFITSHSKEDAVDAFADNTIHCVIVDMDLPDGQAYSMLEAISKMNGNVRLPVILYTGKSLSQHEEKKIRQYAGTMVLRTADTFKKLADDITFFLHLHEHHDEKNRRVKPYVRENALGGKHVLIVDDDVRNIFSLTKLLENKKMVVSSAIDGNEAIATLGNDPTIDLVLMDMMMPNKDGYETISEIRQHEQLKKTKIIAVTAKAMSGDREKCIRAGANDYITKPVDTDQLVSLLKVWLYK